MIRAMILAAGRSRRMGTQKLLLPFAGRTVIGHIAGQVLAAAVQEILVILGPDGGRIAEALSGQRATFVANPDPDGDMLSSVRCGLRAVGPGGDGVLVVLGDQPSITTALVAHMIDAFRAAGGGIVLPCYRGRRGHPILFSTTYRQEVLTCHDGVGLRGLLRSHPPEVLELPVAGDSVLSDMDYPEDYRRELERFQA